MKKLVPFNEFMKRKKFRKNCGLCHNIYLIYGDYASECFDKYMKQRRLSRIHPIGENSYVYEYDDDSVSNDLYYKGKSDGTLYTGNQLVLRQKLYDDFVEHFHKSDDAKNI